MSFDILKLAECVVRVVGDGLFCSSVGGGAVLHAEFVVWLLELLCNFGVVL